MIFSQSLRIECFGCGGELQQVTESVDVCVEDKTVNYLNRKDVQKAFHARLVGVNRWLVCSK